MSTRTGKKRSLLGPNSQAETFRKLDGRGIVARRMKAIRDDLSEALGGEKILSPQQRLIIDIVTVRVIRCQMLTATMLGDDGLSAEAERRLNWHLASLRRDLQALGLEKRGKAPPSLAEVLGQGRAA